MSKIAQAILGLQGKWGVYGSYVDLAGNVLVTLGGLYAIGQAADCNDAQFKLMAKQFIQASYLYLGVSVILPVLYNKFLAHLGEGEFDTVSGYIARQFWIKAGALAILAWLAYRAWTRRSACSQQISLGQVVKDKLKGV
jgi:hypothetical protein